MAKFRYVYTDFWNDTKVIERFTPEDKLFWLYLLTNSHTKQIGVYRIPRKVLAFELGYSIESTTSLLERFEYNYKLIKYNKDTGEVAIKNWGKYNLVNGGLPIECCIKSELKTIDDKDFVLYVLDGVKNEKLKLFIIECLKEYGTYYGTYDDTYHDTSTEESSKIANVEENNKGLNQAIPTARTTIRGENKNENKNIKEKINNIYSVQDTSSDETSETLPANDISKVPYEEIIAQYNAICKSLPKVKARSKARDKSMKSLYRKLKSLEKIAELFSKVESSDFLSGRDGKWSNCGFDWILKESNYIKILEGNYDNKSRTQIVNPSNNTNNQRSNKGKLRFDNFTGRQYDYDALEKKLLGWDDEEDKDE